MYLFTTDIKGTKHLIDIDKLSSIAQEGSEILFVSDVDPKIGIKVGHSSKKQAEEAMESLTAAIETAYHVVRQNV